MNENYGNDFLPASPKPAPSAQSEVMPLKDWVITLIILAIPCIGIIMMFVWGFGDGNENRKNYCRASLIVTAIGILLVLIMYGIIGAAVISVLSNLY